MKDLRILYTGTKGRRIVNEFNTIMDFITAFELDDITDGHEVFAEFFENPLNHKHFNSIVDLYNHCKEIVS